MNQLLVQTATWMNLKTNILSKISQTKNAYCISPFIYNLENVNAFAVKEQWLSRG